MSDHPWLRRSETVAICPVCEKAALYRSHTLSKFDRYRKSITMKRPFRCHSCEWRGWIDETRLRYPAAGTAQSHLPRLADDPIPDIDLVVDEADAEGPQARPAERGTPADAPRTGQTGASRAPAPPPTAAGDRREASSSMQLDAEELFAGADERRLAETLRRDVPEGVRHRSAHRCPRCLEQSLYRSHHRGAWESLKRKLTGRRVYRCHKCGWRGWLVRQL